MPHLLLWDDREEVEELGLLSGGLGGTAWDNGFSPTDKEVLHYFNKQGDCPSVYKVKLHDGPTPLSFPEERAPLRHITSSPKLHLLSVCPQGYS